MRDYFLLSLFTGVKQQPFGFLTQEVVEATTQCLLAEVCFLNPDPVYILTADFLYNIFSG